MNRIGKIARGTVATATLFGGVGVALLFSEVKRWFALLPGRREEASRGAWAWSRP